MRDVGVAAEQLLHRLHLLLRRCVAVVRREHMEHALLVLHGGKVEDSVVVLVVVALLGVVHVVLLVRHAVPPRLGSKIPARARATRVEALENSTLALPPSPGPDWEHSWAGTRLNSTRR